MDCIGDKMTKVTKETNEQDVEKLITAISATLTPLGTYNSTSNPWMPDDVDKLEKTNKLNTYRKIVEACRFFYRKDPLSATTINKLVEIGITDLEITQSTLSENEYRIFTAIKPKLKEFAENMAHEFLLTGLVVPEVQFTSVTKEQLKYYDIKKYNTLTLPTAMWLRDAETITIEYSMLGPELSYYVQIPQELIHFIQSGGTYPDGNRDSALFQKLQILYPEFISEVLEGSTKVLLHNDLIFRRKPQTDTPYPIPYLESALESLYHKRNLRRMDYSIAARVIGAILLFRLGDKDFPLTEENRDELEELKSQIFWRDGMGKNVERIFQLFSNHTLQIDWIMPDTNALLADAKYKDINQEIIFSLGFPRILITGESERTGTSDPQFAMMSPMKTMETFRDNIVSVLQYVINEVARQNNLKYTPVISFKPINLVAFKDFFDALNSLYTGGNVSRQTFAEFIGVNWEDEMYKKEEENKLLKEKQLGEFAPQPFSNQPTIPNSNNNQQNNNNNNNNKQ